MVAREDVARVDAEKQKHRQKGQVGLGRDIVGKRLRLGVILRLARMARGLGIMGAKRLDMAIVLDEWACNGRTPDAVGIMNVSADSERIEKTKRGGRRQDPKPGVFGRESGLRIDDVEPAKREHDRRKQKRQAYDLRQRKPIGEREEETSRKRHLRPYGIVHAGKIVGGYDVRGLRQKTEACRRLIQVIGSLSCARARVERQQERVALKTHHSYLLRWARKGERRRACDAALAHQAQTRELEPFAPRDAGVCWADIKGRGGAIIECFVIVRLGRRFEDDLTVSDHAAEGEGQIDGRSGCGRQCRRGFHRVKSAHLGR